MNDETTSLEIGPVSERKPSIAFNLSSLFTGLGQIYCGHFQRGLLHLVLSVFILLLIIIWLTFPFAYSILLSIFALVLLIPFTIYSAFDARRLARQCRRDYRLKDYNSVLVYAALSFFVLSHAFAIAFTLRENYLASYRMANNSMGDTFQKTKFVFVRKDAYLDTDPQLNDLIAFKNPDDRRQTWIKRVVALPGDVIAIQNGTVTINGKPLAEAKTVKKDSSNLPPLTVPKNHCYVLADDRASANDSRQIGSIPMSALVGKAITRSQ